MVSGGEELFGHAVALLQEAVETNSSGSEATQLDRKLRSAVLLAKSLGSFKAAALGTWTGCRQN